MSTIEIRAEILRIAHAWTLGASGYPSFLTHQREIFRSILIEPYEHGGVRVVSSDGAAMCVQVDRHGSTDGRYLIEGLTNKDFQVVKDKPSFESWFEADPDAGTPAFVDGVGASTLAELPHVRLWGSAPSGTYAYPDWKSVVPSHDELKSMQEGYPGQLSVAYLSVISRLWNGYLADCRVVRLLSHGDMARNAILQFPWSPDMMVVIAPFQLKNGMPTNQDLFNLLPEQDDDDL